ncbi:MAG: hypothetical protein WBW48_21805 [Anaerolineae bacterium]
MGTYNWNTGAEVWRSPDGTTWTQVNADGFGDVNSQAVAFMAVLGSYLYAGTYNEATGAEVWRSGGISPPEPIGGVIVPVNKLELLAPWVGLAVLIAIGGTLLLRARRRRDA